MFNFGVTEVMIIAIVGLIVIGPERLPKVARTLGHLFGRMQRYVSDIKDDISREVELDELRQLQSSMKEAAQEIEESVSKQVNLIEDEVQQAESETRKTVEEAVHMPRRLPAFQHQAVGHRKALLLILVQDR